MVRYTLVVCVALGACGRIGFDATSDGNVISSDAGPLMFADALYGKASNTGAGDLFGITMAMAADGNTFVVGAFNEKSNATGIDGDQLDNSPMDSGAFYIFE